MSPRAPILSPKCSKPVGRSFAASPGTYSVTVTSDQVVAGLDFGNSQNNPPTVDPGPVFSSSYLGDTNATVGQKYTYTAVAADTDHDQITYSLGLAQPGMVIDPTLGVLDWTPTANRGRLPERGHRGHGQQRQHRDPVLHHRWFRRPTCRR